MTSLLLRNVRMVLDDGSLYAGDLLCRDGTIAQIDRALNEAAERTIDGGGRVLLPGVIDPQVHFREPGKEYKEDLQTGSWACARGGVTSFLEMPNTSPATTTCELLKDKLARAASKCVVNYGFFIGATSDNIAELQQSIGLSCGVKIFMGASTGDLLVDDPVALERIFKEVPHLIAVHAEDEARIRERTALFADRTDPHVHSELRDDECARLATDLALTLSKRYRRRLHILHLSTAAEVALLAADKPAWVTAEVIPQHLFLSTAAYDAIGMRAKQNPPLRSEADRLALWAGLRSGLIDFVATDHAPHLLSEKDRDYFQAAAGMPGVETSLPLMLTALVRGEVNFEQIVRWMSRAAAHAYNIPNKGSIRPGYDADLVLVDLETTRPAQAARMASRCGWTPFEGWPLTGWPVLTVVGGQVVFEEDEVQKDVRGRALSYSPGQS
ncbi:dihydroorotase [Gloeobacter kilaueensis]|uniref:Dihydroorotase n=1 Tax=Gloeobacter kilaueensis (strain ATCC BAA-2537 / CCAP 1431/1 / ULC 316 / JS1) TaxID=1183438 RepID=U5QEB6_GLOK1|nr:dihydroorotase [Gloeobacter kilaueensis]AGY57218.1 dihydroorotase [Gloeobacter kilaueensis JS1]